MTEPELTKMQRLTRHHRDADMLVNGSFGDEDGSFKGCSVGCLAYDTGFTNFANAIDIHLHVAEAFGYPEWLVHFQDVIFEGLGEEERGEWHVQLADAIALLPDNFDWQKALHKTHCAILAPLLPKAGSAKEAVQRVIDLHERSARGEVVPDDEWSAAREAARSAERPAAWYVARSAAWSAAREAARSAAGKAARYAARSAARATTYRTIRDSVLAILAEGAAS